jgi:hypothetical protein
MFRLLTYTAIAAATPNKPNTRKAKPINGGPIGVLVIVICVGVFVWGDASHNWTVMWFWLVPLICAFGIFLGALIKAACKPKPLQRRSATNDNLARMKQVQALLKPTCPTCRAPFGASCKVTAIDVPYVLLDEKWRTFAHFSRIEQAVKLRLVGRNDIIAQFDNKIPDGLNI